MKFPLRGILFDFDDTLCDTSHLLAYRNAQDWPNVHARLNSIQAFRGIPECLERLRAKGYRIGVVTNSPADIPQTVLQRLGIAVDAIVGFHDTERHKPDPQPLHEGARRLEITPSRCAAIGDRCQDIRAAKEGGFCSIGAEWGASVPKDLLTTFPEFIASTPIELADILLERFDSTDGPLATIKAQSTKDRISDEFWSEEESPHIRRRYLDQDDLYFFGRWRYQGGFSASYANQLISNFKMPVRFRNGNRWPHKQAAVNQYAYETARALPENATVFFLPSSKLPDHPEYDPRLEMLARVFTEKRPDIRLVNPIEPRVSTEAVHEQEDPDVRDPEVIGANLIWNDSMPEGTEKIYILDDVITSGGHFKAYKNLLRHHLPNIEVCGLFWTAER